MNVRILIAAAAAMALPALAADPPARPATAPAAKSEPAKSNAAKASDKIAVGTTEAAAPKKDEKRVVAPAPEQQKTLRFQRWVHDEDKEY